jgi:hypothetical protein
MTSSPDNHNAPFPAQALSTPSTPVSSTTTNASLLTTSPSALPTTQPSPSLSSSARQQNSRGRIQLWSSISRLTYPREDFPVQARGIAVYTLWNRPPAFSPTAPPSLPPEIWLRERTLGSWYTLHLAWKPSTNTSDEALLSLEETKEAYRALLTYVDTLVNTQDASGVGIQPAQPIYQILHVRELQSQIPRFYRLRTRQDQNTQQQEVFNARRRFVNELRDYFDLQKEDAQNNWFPTTYEHYDRNTRTRGWIIINPSRALVAGVSDREARILAGQIQHRDTDPSGQQKGIAANRYEDVLGRIGLWNSTQDIGETVTQLEVLVASGQKSTDGQVLLNLALAAIGILLTLAPTFQLASWQLLTALALLSLSSILFWFYARSGNVAWLRIGLLILVATLILDTATAWYQPVIQFFLHF